MPHRTPADHHPNGHFDDGDSPLHGDVDSARYHEQRSTLADSLRAALDRFDAPRSKPTSGQMDEL